MDAKKLKKVFEILFIIGLCLAVFVMILRRCAILPNYYRGLLGGIAVTLILGAGAMKHLISDGGQAKIQNVHRASAVS